MNKQKNNKTYRTYRIRPEAIEVYAFLEYLFIKKTNNKHCMDDIIKYAYNFVRENRIYYKLAQYDNMRKVKGFTISNDTIELLQDLNNKNPDFLLAEIIELFICIYSINNLSLDELKLIDTSWITEGETIIYL